MASVLWRWECTGGEVKISLLKTADAQGDQLLRKLGTRKVSRGILCSVENLLQRLRVSCSAGSGRFFVQMLGQWKVAIIDLLVELGPVESGGFEKFHHRLEALDL